MAGRRSSLAAPFKAALEAVSAALDDVGRGMVIGGIAVIARGVARTTRDVDATVALDGDLETLVKLLARHDLVPRIEGAIQFAEANQVLLLRHEPSAVDVDLSIAWLPFELEALAAAERVTLAGLEIPVARAEDLVIYKAVAWRPQDQQDVERLLSLHGRTMDLERIRRRVAEFAEALEDSNRVDEVERVIRRALD